MGEPTEQWSASAYPNDSEPARTVRPGQLLGGRYRLDVVLARGATAEVFRGSDEQLGRPVAIKVFDPLTTDLNSVGRRRVEVEVLASLNDPHLVIVYDAHVADPGRVTEWASETSYVVMELVEGPTLAQEIENGPVEPARVARVGVAVAAALETMHCRGLVHRDIKPANIMSTRDGAVKLGDVGLARVLNAEDRVTSAPLVMGTAAFFSPEQARGQDVEAPSDVYSLGLVLLEALTGQREYSGSPIESAVARLLRPPMIPAALPVPWPLLLTAMTSENPQERPTAGAVRDALAAAYPVAATPRASSPSGPSPTGNSSPTGTENSGPRPIATAVFGRTAVRFRKTRLVMASVAAAEAVALSAVLLFSTPSATSPAGPAQPPARPAAATSVEAPVPAPAVARPSTSTTEGEPSRRATTTTNGRSMPSTKPASPAGVDQKPRSTLQTPLTDANPVAVSHVPETVPSALVGPNRSVIQGAASGSKKDKIPANGTEKSNRDGADKGSVKTSNGKGKGKGTSKRNPKGAQP